MLTIFCSPKPFTDEATWNQLNALRSWRAIHPEIEIIIFGAPSGVKDVATEINAVLVPEIESSPSGAPSFNAMQKYVNHFGRYNLQVYVNCDILLNATLVKAMLACYDRFGRFLMVGERFDLVQGATIDATKLDQMNYLLSLANDRELISHGPAGVDYFGFTRGIWNDLGLVYMGRAMCDQALLHYCLTKHFPIIDATQVVLAIHQYHDYFHVAGGRQEVYYGEDYAFMANEHQLHHSLPTIRDADWRFDIQGEIVLARRRTLRHWELTFRYHYKIDTAAYFLRALQYLRGKKRFQPARTSIEGTIFSWNQFLKAH